MSTKPALRRAFGYGAIAVGIVAGIALLVLPSLVPLRVNYETIEDWMGREGWARTEGVILDWQERTVETGTRISFGYEVEYRYEVNGRTYVNDRVRLNPDDDHGHPEWEPQAVCSSEDHCGWTIVYYRAADPSESVLIGPELGQPFWLSLLYRGGTIVLGLVAIGMGFRRGLDYFASAEAAGKKSELLSQYLDADGRIAIWPDDPEHREEFLRFLANKVKRGKVYSRDEIERVLKQHCALDDHEMVLRQLVSARYFDTTAGDKQFWRLK
jgi:hypothetical protein